MNTEHPADQRPPVNFFYFTSLESFEQWYELLLALDSLNNAKAAMPLPGQDVQRR